MENFLNRYKSQFLRGALAVAAMLCLSTWTRAADTQVVDIHVSIQSSKAISADTTSYDFGAIAINTSSNSAAPIVINNESTALIETYTIRGADAVSDSGGADWTLASSTDSTGINTYALAAQFSSSRPDNEEASWAEDHLNKTTPVVCSTTVLGDGTANDEGAGVIPGESRYLWLRIKTPTAVTDLTSHTATITVSVY